MSATLDYWPLVLEHLHKTLKESAYKAWFSRVAFVKTTNSGRKIVLLVPNSFSKKYIEQKHKPTLLESIKKYYPQVIHIDLEVDKEAESADFQKNRVLSQELPIKKQTSPKKNKREKQAATFATMAAAETVGEEVGSYLPKKNINNLNPRYTFDNFVVTANNEFAYNVAKAVVDEPGKAYNPVFLHGGVGLGKTHLIQAIGQKLLEKNPSFNIKYTPMETFVSQFMIAVRKGQMPYFKNYYRSIDLLLIDDVQFIAGKESTQNEFFHTFNSLSQESKQIIFTSDRHPGELNGVADRLISRFNSGVTVDISQPDLEARIAILNDKIERANIQLTDFQIQQIAERVDTNIRELEGILNKICAKIKFNPGQEFGNKELAEILNARTASSVPAYSTKTVPGFSQKLPGPSSVAADKYLYAVCRHFGLDRDDLLGVSRQKDISLARQVLMYLYKRELDLSYPAIGRLFGNRDHTTVMHAAKKITAMLESDTKMQEQVQIICQTVG